jgi:ElaB/YqjD/DUF883 family membrane-anchored ribosome-binding protein
MASQGTDRNQSGGQQSRTSSQESDRHRSSPVDKARETVGEVRERASEVFEDASEWAEDTYGRVSHWASDAYEHRNERLRDVRRRSTQSMQRVGGTVQDYVSENPMVVGIVGLAAGLLIGALLPRTRRENEAFGEWADELRHQGVRYAREATQRGRELLEEGFDDEDPQFSKHASEFRRDRDRP